MPQSADGNGRVAFGLSRREFLALGAAGALAATTRGGVVWAGGRVPLTFFQVVPLGEPPRQPPPPGGTWSDVNVLVGEGGNSLVAAKNGASLLVDTKNAPFGRLLATEEAWRVGADFSREMNRLVINTHHHADHTGGNWALTGRVPVVAHQAAKDRIRAQVQRYIDIGPATVRRLEEGERPLYKLLGLEAAKAYLEVAQTLTAADFEPTRTVSEPFERFNVGEIEVEVHHFGAGHTDNDLVVRLPRYNVVHAGDLLFHKVWPFIDRGAGATTEGWVRSLEGVIGLCDRKTIVVPGHGEVTDVSGVREQIEVFRAMRKAVGEAIRRGAGREEVTRLPMSEFKGYGEDRRRGMALGAVYDELTGADAE